MSAIVRFAALIGLLIAGALLAAEGSRAQPQLQPSAGSPDAAPAQPQPPAPPSAFGGAPPAAFARPAQQQAAPRDNAGAGWLTRLQIWIVETQQQLHRDLAKAVRELKSDPFTAGLTLIGLSFLYGVLHAAGPGHGKAIISSYVVANRQTARRGVAIALASSVVQGVSAVALVLVLGLVLNMAGFRMQMAVAHLETVSFAAVALVGAWLFLSQLRRVLRERLSRVWSRNWSPRPASLSAAAVSPHGAQPSHPHNHHPHHHHGHAHDADCGCGHSHMPPAQALEGAFSWRRASAIVLAVGIRPCTGAVLVLVFALTQGLFWAGVLATFAMALGTAITVSALTVAAVTARDLTARAAAKGGGALASIFYDALALGGTFLILAIGAVLFLGSLGPARPF